MNPAHAHLMLNHVPVLFTFLGAALLGWGSWRGERGAARAGLMLFVAAALAALPVYWSGHEAEELVERMPGASEALIERHEEAAGAALAALLALGALSAWALRRDGPGRRLFLLVGALALAAAALVGRAAFLGGQIRHPELQPDWKSYGGEAPWIPTRAS